MLPWLAAALVFAAVPESQQFTFPSLPAKLQPLLQAQQKKAAQASSEPIWLVQKIEAGQLQVLWVLTGPQPRFCRPSGCTVHIYLAHEGRFRLVGETRGWLNEVNETGPTLALRFAEEEAPGQQRWHSLTWKVDRYEVAPPQVRFLDPITHEWLSSEAIDRAARTSVAQGYFAAAAGRWALLCHAGCSAEQKDQLKSAEVKAGIVRPEPKTP